MSFDRRKLLKLLTFGTGIGATFGSGIPAVGAEGATPSVADVQGARYGPPVPFDFDRLKDRARAVAAKPYVEPAIADAAVLDKIDYSNHAKIWFLEKFGVWRGEEEPGPVHFFHPGTFFKDPVRIHVVEAGTARQVLPSSDAFGYPGGHPAGSLTHPPAYAGFKLLNKGTFTDWLSFIGKSYFRSSGPFDQYGLSARGILIDAGLPTPEEFPRFSEFWLEDHATFFVVHALLEGESLAGAYRMEVRGGHDTIMDLSLSLYARKDIKRLGIAPLTSMYWYSEDHRDKAVDWRPEIHDSDGLLMRNGYGETLWRPLNNPPRIMTNSFSDQSPRGFGLIQRDRAFASYADPALAYHKRPSAWVEPLSDWGKGVVQLLEIPTDDEIHDNIGAYWVPDELLRKGDERSFRYRLSWIDQAHREQNGARGNPARVLASRSGTGGIPEQARPDATRRFVIDFEKGTDGGIPADALPEARVSASRGQILRQFVVPGSEVGAVGENAIWRLVFDLKAEGTDALDLRADLIWKSKTISETWIYQTFPATWPNAADEKPVGNADTSTTQ